MNKKLKIIGVTGNSGSGKSFICEILLNKYDDIVIVDADKIARKMSDIGTLYYKEVVNMFGKSIVTDKLEIDRKLLAEIIFNDDEKRKELNSITFRYVVDEIKNNIKLNSNRSVIVIDVPLLFESGLDEICDITLGVVSDEDIKINRICSRDGVSVEQAKDRLKVQLGDEDLKGKCDYIIENNGDIGCLDKQLEKIFFGILYNII